MSWGSAQAFFDMGGYGLYVWGAYGVTALVMAAQPLWLARRLRRRLDEASERSGTPPQAEPRP
jgi:heme exporter protein D